MAAPQQSVGGVWIADTPPLSELTLFIAETGELRTVAPTPSFGTGAVIVTGNDRVSGSLKTRTFPTGNFGVVALTDQDCVLDGTVRTRASLQITLRCTSSNGTTTERALRFVYDSSYDQPSSLAAIAGNYTFEFRPMTNSLNVNGDGTIFGVWDNGPQCLVNGRVEIIDARFDLYRLTFTFANCTRATFYEGVTLTGLARRNAPALGGGFFAVLSGTVGGAPQFFSLLYKPV